MGMCRTSGMTATTFVARNVSVEVLNHNVIVEVLTRS